MELQYLRNDPYFDLIHTLTATAQMMWGSAAPSITALNKALLAHSRKKKVIITYLGFGCSFLRNKPFQLERCLLLCCSSSKSLLGHLLPVQAAVVQVNAQTDAEAAELRGSGLEPWVRVATNCCVAEPKTDGKDDA